jgi:xanthine dehydrogenase YagT iron-sulfur-binding subunit
MTRIDVKMRQLNDSKAAVGLQGLEPRRTKPVSLDVNGKLYSLKLECRTTLAEALREHLGLTGTKIGCNRAECGTCTVIMDGRAVYSCTVLAVEAAGKRIQTIEGLAEGDKLHPLQELFIKYDALQCGYCTPGIIMSLKAFLDRRTNVTRDEIREAIAGNYCRCGSFHNIEKAVEDFARRQSDS